MEGIRRVEAPERHPYRALALAAVAVVLLFGLAAAVLVVWLRGYAPLDARGGFAPGPGLAAPPDGAAGKATFVPAGERRTFDTAFTLRNTGRFTITVEGVEGAAASGLRPVSLLGTDSSTASADPGHLRRFAYLRIRPDESAILVAHWQVGCGANPTVDTLRLRYSYLSLFERTQDVTLPFAVTVRCARQTP